MLCIDLCNLIFNYYILHHFMVFYMFILLHHLLSLLFFFFEAWSYFIAQADLMLFIQSNLSFLSAGIISMNYHTYLI